MIYNTGNGASFRNHQINHKLQEKDSGYYYCWKLRKKKVKHQILFRNYSSKLARTLSTIRAGRATAVEKMFMGKLTRASYLEMLVLYLNNSSEETIFASNKIKEQHETMKLQNEVH